MSRPIPQTSLWKSRNFRLHFSAHAISNLGDGVAILAYPWLATLISRDPMDVAFVVFAARLPWFLLTLPAGVITDRIDHKALMFWSDIFRVLVTFAVVAVAFAGPDLSTLDNPRGLILALAAAVFLLGSAEVLHDNTGQTILPSLVNANALARANGAMGSAEHVIGQFVGPPLAGFLIALALPLPFVLDAVSFALAAILISRLQPRPIKRPAAKPALKAMREGLAWIFKRPLLMQLAVITGLMNLIATIALTILVLFAQDILGLGAVGYGLLLTAGAVGGALGGVVAPQIIARIGQGWGLRIAVMLSVFQCLLIGFASSAWLAAAGLFLGVFGGMIWNVVAVPLRQRIVPSHLLGRVNSVYRFFAWGMIPIGALLGGALVKVFEPFTSHETALRLPYFLVAGGFAMLALYALIKFSNQSVIRQSTPGPDG